MKRQLLISGLITFSMLGVNARPAHAAIFADNDAREVILNLQSQVSLLKTQVTALQTSMLDQNNQITRLNNQIALLVGQNQEDAKQLSELKQLTQDHYNDLDFRLKKFEPQQVTINGVSGLISPKETPQFNQAKQAFQNKHYQAALQQLKVFIQDYPDSPYQASAQFWLGNSAYALNRYKTAEQAWKTVISRFPQFTLTPNAMLLLANLYIEKKQNQQAKAVLSKLLSRYPNSNVIMQTKRALASLK